MHSLIEKAYKNKKVLVTGHTGFKGSWLSLFLIRLSARVIGYSWDIPTKPSLYEAVGLKDKIRHISADVRNQQLLVSVFNKLQPEFVFHLAAQPLVRVSYKEPRLTYETNVLGTVNLLEAVRKTKSVKVCIIVTSDKCYENKERHSYKETDPLGGHDPYSSSKACAEIITAAYRQSFFRDSLALSTVRAGNVIGGGDWGRDRLVPDCVRALSQDKRIIIRYPRAIRPWQHVQDVITGYLLLAALMARHPRQYSGPWNFGPGDKNMLTVEKLLKLVIACWGKGKYALDKSAQPHEAGFLSLNSTKANRLLGWRQLYGITEAVENTVGWYKKFYYSKLKKRELFEFTQQQIHAYFSRMKNAYEGR